VKTRVACVVPAAGTSTRMRGIDKLMVSLAGRPLLEVTLRSLVSFSAIDELVVVYNQRTRDQVERICRRLDRRVRLVEGGRHRQESVQNGLNALRQEPPEIVLVHDAARPLIDAAILDRVVGEALATGAAVPALPVRDTIKVVRRGIVEQTPERSELYAAQTPQGFRFSLLLEAHHRAAAEGYVGTDDAGLVERLGYPVAVVEGSPVNIKVTTPEDLRVAEAHMGRQRPEGDSPVRTGFGYDVHRLGRGGPLVLGGVEMPFESHLIGHSDADVLLHAIMDALLGAAALGDIGSVFPDTDPAYRGISSLFLLEKVAERLEPHGFVVTSVDATVVAERPRLQPYMPLMRENIAGKLGIDLARVSVKATTTEGLGFAGRMEGIAAYAIVSLLQRG